MFSNKRAYQNLLFGGIFLCCMTVARVCQAQITTDGTVSTEITSSDNIDFVITGGRTGGNLLVFALEYPAYFY